MLKTKPKRGDRVLLDYPIDSKHIPELVTIDSSGSDYLTVGYNGRRQWFDLDGRGHIYYELWEPEAYHAHAVPKKLRDKIRSLVTDYDFCGFSLDKLNRIIEAFES